MNSILTLNQDSSWDDAIGYALCRGPLFVFTLTAK